MDAERELAVAVIQTAVDDLCHLGSDDKSLRRDAEEALHFLWGGPLLPFWCALAGLDTEAVISRTKQIYQRTQH